MNPTYRKISDIAHNHIYQFVKKNDIQLTSYNFNHYFQNIISSYKIKTFPHHFDNEVILGITMIDENGITISWEENCIAQRQNFTKCHELGHLFLEHNGSFFLEQEHNKNQQEIEANYFASIVLMPDIVLLTHILYKQLTYQQLQQHLDVSNKALAVRLTHFLQSYTDLSYPLAQSAVSSFRANTASREKLINYVRTFEEEIIQKYNSIQLSPLEQISKLLQSQLFISQLDCEYITDPDLIKQIKLEYPDIESDVYFDFGKTIQYLYQSNQLSKPQAEKMAKDLIFNLIF